jgi:hypothetical protein
MEVRMTSVHLGPSHLDRRLADSAYVVPASPRATTGRGRSAAALGDVAVAVALVFALALAPALVIRLVAAAVRVAANAVGVTSP